MEQHALFVEPDDTWVSTILRARARGMRASIITTAAHARCFTACSSAAHDTNQVDTRDPSVLKRAIATVHSERPVTAVLISSDRLVGDVAVACGSLGIGFTSAEAVATFRDKARTRQLLQDRGIRSVRWRPVETGARLSEAVRQLGFPCIVKPRSGHLSRLAVVVQRAAVLEERLREIEERIEALPADEAWVLKNGLVCEEWIAGPIVSIELAIVGREIVVVTSALGTQQALDPSVGYGSVIPVVGAPETIEECIAYATSICGSVTPTLGVWDVEMVVSQRGPTLVEVNPRRMGGRMLAAYNWATGGKFEDVLLDVYSGLRPRPVMGHPDRVVVIRKLLAAADGRVADSWNPTPLLCSDSLQFVNDGINAGGDVKRMEVLGRLLVRAKGAQVAFARANRVVDWIEQRAGIRLVRGTLPNLREHTPMREANVRPGDLS